MLGFFWAEAPVEGLTCEEVDGLLTDAEGLLAEEDGFDTDEDRDTDDPCLFAEEDDCDVDVPLLTCAWASN